MKIEIVHVDELKPAEYNPRALSDDAKKQITESLKKFGMVDPVIVNKNKDRNNIIVGGHQRVKLWAEMGRDLIPCVYVDLPLEEERELNVRLNKNLGDWDWDMLKMEFNQDELIDWGFEDINFNIEHDDEETQGDDDVPDAQKESITVLGDLYELGDHRLLCGDSTMIDDVEKLMNGEKAVLAHNDPPYGMKKEKDGIKNDNLNYADLLRFNNEWIPLQFSYLKDNGAWYCWGTDEPLMDIYSNILKPLIKSQKATFRNLITWNKGSGQGILSEVFRCYPTTDEKCLFVMCGVQGSNNNADNYFDGWEGIRQYFENEIKKIGKSDKQIANDLGYKDGRTINHWWSRSQWNFLTEENYKKLQKYCKTNNIDSFKKEYDKLKIEYDSTRAYFDNTHDNMTNVWDIGRTTVSERDKTGGHATPKPLELCKRVIKSSSQKGDLVGDFFLGSGSTLISCEKTKRKCYGMELDEKYCDVIVKRYVDFCKNNDRPYSVKRNGEPFEIKS